MIPEKNRGAENENLESETPHDSVPLALLSASLRKLTLLTAGTLLQLLLGPLSPSFTTRGGLRFLQKSQGKLDGSNLGHEIILINQLKQGPWRRLGCSPLLDQSSTAARGEGSVIGKGSLESQDLSQKSTS